VLSVSPRKQFVDPIDLVVSDAGQRIGEPGLRINAVEFGGRSPCSSNTGTVQGRPLQVEELTRHDR